MHIALGVLGFALLGVDPLGAILVATATATETHRGRVVSFLVTALVATTLLGTVLGLVGRGFVETIGSWVPNDTSSLWLILNVIIIVAISAWLGVRFARRNQPKKDKVRKRRLLNSTFQYVFAGAVFGVSSATDPTLYGAVSLAAENGNVAIMAAASATWFLVSQFMLVAYVVGFVFGAHQRLVGAAQRWWARHRDKAEVALYVTAGLVVLFFLADTIIFAVTGRYIF